MAEERKERPAYTRFETRPMEDRVASMAAGVGAFRTKDIDFVIITPVGTKDEIPRVVSEWLPHLKQQAKEGRLPEEHLDIYTKRYHAWKQGQELPSDGTALKGWPVIGPSQLANCLAANVRTVEDLAVINGEAAGRIGMGAQELRNKAEMWLKASKDTGAVVQINAALTAENERLKARVAELEKQATDLATKLAAATGQVAGAAKVTVPA